MATDAVSICAVCASLSGNYENNIYQVPGKVLL